MSAEDRDYLLALAEEEHIRREAVYLTRLRMARMERIAEIRARLLEQIRWLMYAPFSWQLSTNNSLLLRTLSGRPVVNGTGGENIQKTVAGCSIWIPRNDLSLPSDTRQCAGSQGACLSEKPSAREVMHARSEQPIPGNAVPIAPWPVTPRGVSHAGNAEYPDRKAEEGHGEKGEVLPEGKVERRFYTWDHVR